MSTQYIFGHVLYSRQDNIKLPNGKTINVIYCINILKQKFIKNNIFIDVVNTEVQKREVKTFL